MKTYLISLILFMTLVSCAPQYQTEGFPFTSEIEAVEGGSSFIIEYADMCRVVFLATGEDLSFSPDAPKQDKLEFVMQEFDDNDTCIPFERFELTLYGEPEKVSAFVEVDEELYLLHFLE